jgi:dethiobiotin synthase
VLRGIFVTGTDTGVGKTVAAAALLLRYRGIFPVKYWKPIQTGIEQDDDTAEVRRLASCRPADILAAGVRLERPVSPHLAARLAGRPIDLNAVGALAFRESDSTRLIVEGAGGVLVPVSEKANMADLMVGLGLPAVVVARTALGTINHTLLTIEALRRRRVHAAGVIMVGVPNADNQQAIEQYGGIPVLGVMPQFSPLTPERLAEWVATELDPNGRLGHLLR